MKDHTFKVRLFHFIDLLPALRDDEQVFRLLDEYFGDFPSLPSAWQWGLRAAPLTPLGSKLTAYSVRKQVHGLARLFIAGETAEEEGPVLAWLWQTGRAFSMDLLGEATVSEHEADRYRDRYVRVIGTLS